VAGRKTDAKTTPKERETVMATTIGRRYSRSKRRTRSKCCLLCCRWSFLAHRRPSSAAPAVGHYCAKAAMKSRCASPEVLQERVAV